MESCCSTSARAATTAGRSAGRSMPARSGSLAPRARRRSAAPHAPTRRTRRGTVGGCASSSTRAKAESGRRPPPPRRRLRRGARPAHAGRLGRRRAQPRRRARAAARSRPAPVAPVLDALEVDARAEMARHWGRIRDYLLELFRHQGIEAVVAEELALLPGAEELATLLAVEEHGARGATTSWSSTARRPIRRCAW